MSCLRLVGARSRTRRWGGSSVGGVGRDEAAWAFFEGVPNYLVIDNLPSAVAGVDPLHPRLTRGFLEYSQHRGFISDPARVRHPRDKPRVERGVPYVRERFFKGGEFTGLADMRGPLPGAGAWRWPDRGCTASTILAGASITLAGLTPFLSDDSGRRLSCSWARRTPGSPSGERSCLSPPRSPSGLRTPSPTR